MFRKIIAGLTLTACLGGWTVIAVAQDPGVVPHGIKERDPVQALMSERTFKRLASIHESLGARKYQEVVDKLKVLEKARLSNYEDALIVQTYGFVYAQQGDYPRGIQYFEQAIALDALPNAAQQGMLFSLASLLTGEQQFQKSIDTLIEWFAYELDPNALSYILMATNYVEMERYREALPYVRTAIATNTSKPNQSWYQLEAAIHFELSDYAAAAATMRAMLTHWPDKLQFWETLAGAYQEQKKDWDALATLTLAYQKGLITDEKKLLNIARLNIFLEDPYTAGRLLEKEMQAGHVARTQKNLELLLTAWKGSREFEAAIAVIDQIAPMTRDGEYYLEKAQLYSERNMWEETISAALRAIDRGGLKRPGTAHVVLGQAYTEIQQYRKALDAFALAQRYDNNSRKIARGWIDYVRDRMNAASTQSGP